MVVKGLALSFTVLAYWFYKPPKITTTSPGKENTSVVATDQQNNAQDTYAYDNSTVDRS